MCGLQCVEFFLKLVAVVNPDPTRELVFDQISMVNEMIYATPLAGKTAAESVVAIGELAGLGGDGVLSARPARAAAEPGRVRVELWERLREGGARLAMVVGEYDASQVRLGELEKGGLLRLDPCLDEFGRPLFEAETAHEDGFAASTARDRDEDGTADLVDNCVQVANPTQADADGDDFGDACDADLDQDGRVGEGDLTRLEACQDVDVTVAAPVLEPAAFDGEPLGEVRLDRDALGATRAVLCAAADLDGNGRVDAVDARLAEGLVGGAPGPSAVARDLLPPASPPGPVCVDAGPIQHPFVELARLEASVGQQRIRLRGTLVPQAPFDPPIDPVADGIAFSLRDAAGRQLLAVEIPGGEFDPATGVGWIHRRRSGVFRYVNAGAPGIDTVVLRAEGPVRWQVRVEGDRVAIPVPRPKLPLRWELNLDPRPAATDRCAGTDFQAAPAQPSCVVTRRGSAITCQ
jgi:hypothetical protein